MKPIAEEFLSNPTRQDAVMRRIQIIGEAVRHLSHQVVASIPDFPAKEARGMRNVTLRKCQNPARQSAHKTHIFKGTNVPPKILAGAGTCLIKAQCQYTFLRIAENASNPSQRHILHSVEMKGVEPFEKSCLKLREFAWNFLVMSISE